MAQDDSTDKGRTARRTGSTELKRNALRAPSLVFIVIAAIAPLAACAANIPLIIGHGNGIAAPLDFVLMGVVLALFSCGYTAMSEHMVNAGAFWAYVSEGLGRVAGAAAGYLALVSYNVLTVCTSAMGGYIVSRNLGFELGIDLPWWAVSAVLWVVVWLLGAAGVDVGARFLGVCLVLELVIIVAAVGAVVLGEGLAAFLAASFAPESFVRGSPGLGLVFAFACYLGFEATAEYSEEARDARRTVPRATFAALALVGALFVAAAWAMLAALGPEAVRLAQGEDAGTILYRIVAARLGAGFGHVYNWFYMLSSIACWVSAHNAATRYLYVFGRAGLLPRVLARTHPRRRSPYVAGLAQAAFGGGVLALAAAAGLSPYAQIGATASALACVGVMLLELLASVAAFCYLRRHAGEPGFEYGFLRARVAPVLAAVALGAVSVLVMANLSALTEQESFAVNLVLGCLMPAVLGVGWLVAARRARRGTLPDPAGISVEG